MCVCVSATAERGGSVPAGQAECDERTVAGSANPDSVVEYGGNKSLSSVSSLADVLVADDICYCLWQLQKGSGAVGCWVNESRGRYVSQARTGTWRWSQ